MIIRSLALLVVFGFLVLGVAGLHIFGEPTETAMDDYFLENGQQETGSNNIVNSVVFDYRGLDTLGEATILFSAVVGITMILRRGSK